MKQEERTQQKERPNQNWLAKASIMALLNWDEMDYAQFVYEQGLAYIRAYLRDVQYRDYNIGVLERSKTFWTWWKNHWAQRDEMFIATCCETGCSTEEARKLYSQCHSGTMLAHAIHPNAVVLEESYLEMAHKILETELVKA
jgi:hypothetical protein